MPTYDYLCDSCGIAFEVQHNMTDTPVMFVQNVDKQLVKCSLLGLD